MACNPEPMDHRRTTIDQFTRQARGFATAASINDEGAMRAMLDAARLGGAETVLDVACGPGIVAAAFAAEAGSVVGVDLTPRMVELAEERCRERRIDNARFEVGDATALPYGDGEFDRVVSRYALHHMPDPAAVVGEMARVCAPGGRVVVTDLVVGDDPTLADRFNAAERIRDPSHCRAMSELELEALLSEAGLHPNAAAAYTLPMELEALLARSAAPDPDAVREAFTAAIDDGLRMGIDERREDGAIRFEFAVAIVTGDRGRPGT